MFFNKRYNTINYFHKKFETAMKHLFFAAIILFVTIGAKAQSDKNLAPYQKDSMLPTFSILETDSSTWFNSGDIPKNKSVIIVYFNPECGHCQLTAHEFQEKMDAFKDDFFIWVSFNKSMTEIRDFAVQYKLVDAKNVRIGRDTKYFIPTFFKLTYTPYIAVYNEQGKLLETYDGGTDTDTLIDLLHKY
ncbi:hypothetical protein BH11BAC6_BH11BAC6_18400 [soil metagenome]